MTDTEAQADLIIVGAGLVGASLAAVLAEQDPRLRIILLDSARTPERYRGDRFDPRVVALSPASQALLEEVHVWPEVAQVRACPYRQMHVWDGEGTGSIDFSSDDLHLPALGHIVENSLVVSALHQRLHQYPNVECRFGERLSGLTCGSPVTAEVESGQRLRAPLVIAADGATSRVRSLADFETREWDYGQSAIVTTVRTAKSHDYTAWQRFQTSGPLAFLPLQQPAAGGPDSRYASIVWSVVSDKASELMKLDDAAFRRALGNAFEHRLGDVEWVDERVCVPLRQRHAKRYWQPGVALVGDAAHSLHPLAGQGVNLGLRDARVLSEEILRARQRGFQLSDTSLLKRYERRRQPHNLAAMAAMEGFKRLFGADDLALRWLRNTGMAFVSQQSWLKRRLARLAME